MNITKMILLSIILTSSTIYAESIKEIEATLNSMKYSKDARSKAQSLLKEITPIQNQSISPKMFLAMALVESGLESYQLSDYLEIKELRNGDKMCPIIPKSLFGYKIPTITHKDVKPSFIKNLYRCQYNFRNLDDLVVGDNHLAQRSYGTNTIGLINLSTDDKEYLNHYKTITTPQEQFIRANKEYTQEESFIIRKTDPKVISAYKHLWG